MGRFTCLRATPVCVLRTGRQDNYSIVYVFVCHNAVFSSFYHKACPFGRLRACPELVEGAGSERSRRNNENQHLLRLTPLFIRINITLRNFCHMVSFPKFYAMYQACRATVFQYELSDIDDHQTVVQHLPESFPNREFWLDQLIYWRKRRNKVDYSPYPDKPLDTEAQNAVSYATDFLEVCKQFLRERGCNNVI